MQTDKAHIDNASVDPAISKTKVNPFTKLAEDKKRIAEAVNNNQPLSSLKDIKFVRPV